MLTVTEVSREGDGRSHCRQISKGPARSPITQRLTCVTIGHGMLSEEAVGGAIAARSDFESFYEAHERRLFGTLCLVTGDRSEAEELMQEAFLKMWERWDRLEDVEDLSAYLYRTAFNLFRSRLRRTMRAARRAIRPEHPVDAFELIDQREDLVAALRTLSPRQRAAVVLLDLLDLPSEEAGQILGVKAVSVRTLASQARQALRGLMGEADG